MLVVLLSELGHILLIVDELSGFVHGILAEFLVYFLVELDATRSRSRLPAGHDEVLHLVLLDVALVFGVEHTEGRQQLLMRCHFKLVLHQPYALANCLTLDHLRLELLVLDRVRRFVLFDLPSSRPGTAFRISLRTCASDGNWFRYRMM